MNHQLHSGINTIIFFLSFLAVEHQPTAPPSVYLFLSSCGYSCFVLLHLHAAWFVVVVVLAVCVFALREPGASVHHRLLSLAVWVAAAEITITIICFVHFLLFLLWSWSLVVVLLAKLLQLLLSSSRDAISLFFSVGCCSLFPICALQLLLLLLPMLCFCSPLLCIFFTA